MIAHVIPVGGQEPYHHAAAGCWCYPVACDEERGTIWAHNAKDVREKWERQGEVGTGPWVTVLEGGSTDRA